MTAVAPPLTFQPTSRTGWNSGSSGGTLNGLSHDELSRALNMQNPAASPTQGPPRKTAQRSNSSASLSSASSGSTISPASGQTNGTVSSDVGATYSTRKAKGRPIFVPIGKSEPTAGLSTARPQPVSSASSGPSAASTISALHAPMLPSQQTVNGQTQNQQNGTIRNGNAVQEPTAILHLLPMNGTFERKTITVPFYPDILRIGRQTNQKTAPTPSNGFFDSKVLSRQHAEIYAERNTGRVLIKDVKSSNGTFVNGVRLSPENKESEPHPLQEQDVLELGIDIVSEDQKTVVHHKVAARVEHAGIYAPGSEMSFSDGDQLTGGFVPAPQMKRSGSQSSTASTKATALAAVMQARDINAVSHYPQARPMYTPVTTETIVKKLNRELNLARQQSQDLARSKQCLEALLSGPVRKSDSKSEKMLRQSPSKSSKAHFSDPPAPPPQQPLPEKPDVVAKALADASTHPLLLRPEQPKRPLSLNSSPTRPDHSQALLILTQELKLAKDQIPSLEHRVKSLEEQLQAERSARESAEERAKRLEDSPQSTTNTEASGPISIPGSPSLAELSSVPSMPETDLHAKIERMLAEMNDMKQRMEEYHRRAESAESERDSAVQSLSDMVEQKRRENARLDHRRSRSQTIRELRPQHNGHVAKPIPNGHAADTSKDGAISFSALLAKAGVGADDVLTVEQAATLRQLLAQQPLPTLPASVSKNEHNAVTSQELAVQRAAVRDYAWSYGPAVTVLLLGILAMAGMNRVESANR